MIPDKPNENDIELDVVVELGRKAGETLQTFTEQIIAENDWSLTSLNNSNSSDE